MESACLRKGLSAVPGGGRGIVSGGFDTRGAAGRSEPLPEGDGSTAPGIVSVSLAVCPCIDRYK